MTSCGTRTAAALALATVLAAPAPASSPAPRAVLAQAGDTLGADEAAAVVAAATGGRVLDVRAEGRGERRVFRVKVLLGGGRVRVYRVDAQSGRILDGGS